MDDSFKKFKSFGSNKQNQKTLSEELREKTWVNN